MSFEIILCPQCKKLKQKSKVYLIGSTKTLLGWSPYWDEEGRYHSHDPNKVRTGYNCNRGHTWEIEELEPCPNGDYGVI